MITDLILTLFLILIVISAFAVLHKAIFSIPLIKIAEEKLIEKTLERIGAVTDE